MRTSNLTISHLQYVDYTLILGVPSIENFWAIKAVMRCFELTLGLGDNLHKSRLIEVNVDPSFLVLAENCLYCNIESLPFKYLGL